MTPIIKYIFTILSAAYFVVAGTGYNVVKYCCKNCAREGIESVEQNTCKMQHTPNSGCCDMDNPKQEKNSSSCHTMCRHSDSCSFLRVNVDTPLLETVQLIDVDSVKSVDLLHATLLSLQIDDEFAYRNIHPPQYYSPLVTGRKILTNKSVLLI